MANGDMIDFSEAARRLGISEAELQTKIASGELRGFRSGGAMKFRKSDIDAMAADKTPAESSDSGSGELEIPDFGSVAGLEEGEETLAALLGVDSSAPADVEGPSGSAYPAGTFEIPSADSTGSGDFTPHPVQPMPVPHRVELLKKSPEFAAEYLGVTPEMFGFAVKNGAITAKDYRGTDADGNEGVARYLSAELDKMGMNIDEAHDYADTHYGMDNDTFDDLVRDGIITFFGGRFVKEDIDQSIRIMRELETAPMSSEDSEAGAPISAEIAAEISKRKSEGDFELPQADNFEKGEFIGWTETVEELAKVGVAQDQIEALTVETWHDDKTGEDHALLEPAYMEGEDNKFPVFYRADIEKIRAHQKSVSAQQAVEQPTASDSERRLKSSQNLSRSLRGEAPEGSQGIGREYQTSPITSGDFTVMDKMSLEYLAKILSPEKVKVMSTLGPEASKHAARIMEVQRGLGHFHEMVELLSQTSPADAFEYQRGQVYTTLAGMRKALLAMADPESPVSIPRIVSEAERLEARLNEAQRRVNILQDQGAMVEMEQDMGKMIQLAGSEISTERQAMLGGRSQLVREKKAIEATITDLMKKYKMINPEGSTLPADWEVAAESHLEDFFSGKRIAPAPADAEASEGTTEPFNMYILGALRNRLKEVEGRLVDVKKVQATERKVARAIRFSAPGWERYKAISNQETMRSSAIELYMNHTVERMNHYKKELRSMNALRELADEALASVSEIPKKLYAVSRQDGKEPFGDMPQQLEAALASFNELTMGKAIRVMGPITFKLVDMLHSAWAQGGRPEEDYQAIVAQAEAAQEAATVSAAKVGELESELQGLVHQQKIIDELGVQQDERIAKLVGENVTPMQVEAWRDAASAALKRAERAEHIKAEVRGGEFEDKTYEGLTPETLAHIFVGANTATSGFKFDYSKIEEIIMGWGDNNPLESLAAGDDGDPKQDPLLVEYAVQLMTSGLVRFETEYVQQQLDHEKTEATKLRREKAALETKGAAVMAKAAKYFRQSRQAESKLCAEKGARASAETSLEVTLGALSALSARMPELEATAGAYSALMKSVEGFQASVMSTLPYSEHPSIKGNPAPSPDDILKAMTDVAVDLNANEQAAVMNRFYGDWNAAIEEDQKITFEKLAATERTKRTKAVERSKQDRKDAHESDVRAAHLETENTRLAATAKSMEEMLGTLPQENMALITQRDAAFAQLEAREMELSQRSTTLEADIEIVRVRLTATETEVRQKDVMVRETNRDLANLRRLKRADIAGDLASITAGNAAIAKVSQLEGDVAQKQLELGSVQSELDNVRRQLRYCHQLVPAVVSTIGEIVTACNDLVRADERAAGVPVRERVGEMARDATGFFYTEESFGRYFRRLPDTIFESRGGVFQDILADSVLKDHAAEIAYSAVKVHCAEEARDEVVKARRLRGLVEVLVGPNPYEKGQRPLPQYIEDFMGMVGKDPNDPMDYSHLDDWMKDRAREQGVRLNTGEFVLARNLARTISTAGWYRNRAAELESDVLLVTRQNEDLVMIADMNDEMFDEITALVAMNPADITDDYIKGLGYLHTKTIARNLRDNRVSSAQVEELRNSAAEARQATTELWAAYGSVYKKLTNAEIDQAVPPGDATLETIMTSISVLVEERDDEIPAGSAPSAPSAPVPVPVPVPVPAAGPADQGLVAASRVLGSLGTIVNLYQVLAPVYEVATGNPLDLSTTKVGDLASVLNEMSTAIAAKYKEGDEAAAKVGDVDAAAAALMPRQQLHAQLGMYLKRNATLSKGNKDLMNDLRYLIFNMPDESLWAPFIEGKDAAEKQAKVNAIKSLKKFPDLDAAGLARLQARHMHSDQTKAIAGELWNLYNRKTGDSENEQRLAQEAIGLRTQVAKERSGRISAESQATQASAWYQAARDKNAWLEPTAKGALEMAEENKQEAEAAEARYAGEKSRADALSRAGHTLKSERDAAEMAAVLNRMSGEEALAYEEYRRREVEGERDSARADYTAEHARAGVVETQRDIAEARASRLIGDKRVLESARDAAEQAAILNRESGDEALAYEEYRRREVETERDATGRAAEMNIVSGDEALAYEIADRMAVEAKLYSAEWDCAHEMDDRMAVEADLATVTGERDTARGERDTARAAEAALLARMRPADTADLIARGDIEYGRTHYMPASSLYGEAFGIAASGMDNVTASVAETKFVKALEQEGLSEMVAHSLVGLFI